jgi:hypothetical protein
VKSKRRSFPRSAQTIQRHILGNGDRTLVESKCSACGQIVGTVVDESPEPGETAASFPDLKKLLHFSQQLYAHALTLQEMIRTEGGRNLRGFETQIRPTGGTAIQNVLSRPQAVLRTSQTWSGSSAE